jgi:putative transcriptional regulator
MSDNHSYKGKILIADPFLQGPYFERSVVFMAEHNHEGAMGFILNQPTGILVEQAVDQITNCEFPIYYGGPVDDDILFYVHSLGYKIKNSVQINDRLFWGGDFNELCDLIKKNKVRADEIKFFVGYSGWSKLQLENEMENKSWITDELKTSYLFGNHNKKLWNKCLEAKNNNLSLYSKFEHTPSLN